jgi:hypothetical protein
MMESSTLRDCSTLAGKLDRLVEFRTLLENEPSFHAEFKQAVGVYLDNLVLTVYGLAVNPVFKQMPMHEPDTVHAQAHNWVMATYHQFHPTDGGTGRSVPAGPQ